MPIDAYDPCPCGSGKKFKFCCAPAAEEIEKVQKYQDKHQIQSSLQVLDRMMATKPDLPWSYIVKSNILLSEGEFAAARETLVPLLEKHPDHLFALSLFATTSFASTGYERAKPAIYRSYQRCSKAFPDVVGAMDLGIAAWMFSQHKFMACRQHLVQAMRLVPDDQEKQNTFIRLLEFDSSEEVPYPLRSVHALVPAPVPESLEPGQREERQKLIQRAESLAAIGCFEPAADIYRQLAELGPDSAALWQNAALCLAWDGNEPAAAEAYHKAAKLHSDPDAAIECETLAQLLDLNHPDKQLRLAGAPYKIRSVARLLTLLDEHPQFVRSSEPRAFGSEDEEDKTISYRILDRPALPEDPDLWPEWDAIPVIIAGLSILEEAVEDSPDAMLTEMDSRSRTARDLFESVAAEEIKTKEEGQERRAMAFMALEHAPLFTLSELPSKMPMIRQSELSRRRWEAILGEIWPNMPLEGLGGKTPNQAKGDPELEIPLRAEIYVLDAFCDHRHHLLDVARVCGEFGVAPPAPIETRPDLPLQTFSAMKLHRLKISELSDDQLIYVLNRAHVIQHGRVLYDVLNESLNRPSCADKVDLERTYSTLVDLSRRRDDRDETYRWINEGQKHAQTLDQAFEKTFRWEIRELTFRAEDPGDPNLIPLAYNIVRKYGKKVPQATEFVATILQAFGIEPPADLAQMAEEPGTVSSGGIWTPGESGESTGGKKIWLPGQS